jgi:putative transposase
MGTLIATRAGVGVHAASRLEDFTYRGQHEYAVTCCTFGRRPWFRSQESVDPARAQLLQLSAAESFEVPAYCFMPDHIHVFLRGTSSDSDLRRLLNLWKQRTGYLHKQATGSRLWQGGYFDHVLRGEEDRIDVIRYLLANPIRAGLVDDLRDYAFWGSSLGSREELIELLFDQRVRGG